MKKEKYNIAVIGATGNVGSTLIKILDEVKFPIDNLYALASEKSHNTVISKNLTQTIPVQSIDRFDITKNPVDIAFFCAGSDVSKNYIEKFTNNNCIVIDKSSLFRMDKDIPLIIPEVNADDLALYSKKNIICTPNCTVTPLAIALKPLQEKLGIKRIVVTTLQSVSGTGKNAMDELFYQTKGYFEASVHNEKEERTGNVYSKRIAFNCIPQCGSFVEDNTDEELKLTNELNKLFKAKILLSATCVRVPVFIGHSLSVNVEFEKSFNIEEIAEILENQDGIVSMYDEEDKVRYVTPYEIVGSDVVFLSRLRKDNSVKNGINFWLCCDNIRKGAALNGVQIAQCLIDKYI